MNFCHIIKGRESEGRRLFPGSQGSPWSVLYTKTQGCDKLSRKNLHKVTHYIVEFISWVLSPFYNIQYVNYHLTLVIEIITLKRR